MVTAAELDRWSSGAAAAVVGWLAPTTAELDRWSSGAATLFEGWLVTSIGTAGAQHRVMTRVTSVIVAHALGRLELPIMLTRSRRLAGASNGRVIG